MKIAFLTERMILGFGVDLVIDNVAQGLVDLGHEVTVFAINIDGTFDNRGYKVQKIPCALVWNPLKQEFLAFKALPYIKNLETEFDVFLIETFPFYFYPMFLSKPCIIVDHGVSSSVGMDWKTKVRLGYSLVTKNLFHLPFAAKIITVSDYLKKTLPFYLQYKTEYIHNGADHYLNNKSNTNDVEVVKLKKDLGLKNNDKLLLYVGRLNYEKQPYKGVNDLLEIFLLAKKKNKDIQLLMVGFGDEDDKKYLESKGVKVIVNAPHELMPVIYSACDICVSASKWEGFDLPIAEANSFGKPSVCYDIGPHREVVADGVSGYVVKTQNEFVEKVLTLVQKDDVYKKLTLGAIENSKKFKWENIVRQYDEFILNTVKKSKKSIDKLRYKKDFVDVITLNYNGKKYLKPLFTSLDSQTYKNVDITMVDNGSKDESVDFVKKEFKDVNVISLDKNLFFPKANNIAIERTNGEFVLFLNNDTVVDEEAVSEMVKTIKSDSQIAAVAPKMMLYKNKKVFDAFGTVITRDGSPFNRGIGQYDIGQYDIEEDVFGACFGAVLLKRSVYEKVVGPLDNDYFGYFEDVDWCMRARGMGFRIVTCPKAVVYHDHSGTTKKMGYEWKYFLIQRNFLRTLFKNYGVKHAVKYGSKKILGLIKHAVHPPSRERRSTCIKILLDTFAYFPIIVWKRFDVRQKRIDKITDEHMWTFSVGEQPYFNVEKYEPDYSIDNINHSYNEKYKRREKLKLSDEDKVCVRKALIRLNILANNYLIYDEAGRNNLIDFIQQDLRRDIGIEAGDVYATRLRTYIID